MHALWILLHTLSCLDLSQMSPEINRSKLRPEYISTLSNAVLLSLVPVVNLAFLSGIRLIGRVIWSGVHRAVQTLVSSSNLIFGTRFPRAKSQPPDLLPDMVK